MSTMGSSFGSAAGSSASAASTSAVASSTTSSATSSMGGMGGGMGDWMQIGGGLLGAFGNYQQGQASADSSEANSQIAMLNAGMARYSAEQQVNDIRKNTIRSMGLIRSLNAASGVDVNEGSSIDLEVDQAREGAIGMARAIYNGQIGYNAGLAQAQADIERAKNYKSQGNMAAAGGLLSTGATIFGQNQSMGALK